MRYLFLAILVVQALEIGVLIWSGRTIGVPLTVLLIILTGVLGAYLAKKEGLATLQKLQDNLRRSMMPGDALLDGVCILVGGTLLLAPGFVTDAIGFLLLAPPTRKFFKARLYRFLKRKLDKGSITIFR
ncbi:exlusion protein FxsA [Mesobacillus campisalis]|uniref:Exlusion protein FxsA n=1 Tax=Mesobacillus campisalis TaxID=1408103 RepID=A0A0M2SZD1_9BACI|nr:FxsA family protein [Mesobacillus campisalis]KKK38337.1 exlusion protein FxsA [Mesobacillus campisalis]